MTEPRRWYDHPALDWLVENWIVPLWLGGCAYALGYWAWSAVQ